MCTSTTQSFTTESEDQVKLVLGQAPLIMESQRVDPLYLHNTAPQQRDEGQPSTQEKNATWEIPVVEAQGF